MDFSLSKCKGIWLHKYDLIADYRGEAIKERCSRCGKEIIIKLYNGVTDNNNYLKHHMRQSLVPQHSLFDHEYPRQINNRAMRRASI